MKNNQVVSYDPDLLVFLEELIDDDNEKVALRLVFKGKDIDEIVEDLINFEAKDDNDAEV